MARWRSCFMTSIGGRRLAASQATRTIAASTKPIPDEDVERARLQVAKQEADRSEPDTKAADHADEQRPDADLRRRPRR
jgi:hypothetical protein